MPLAPVAAMLSAERPVLYGVHLNTRLVESVENLNCIPAVWCFAVLTALLTPVVTFVGRRS